MVFDLLSFVLGIFVGMALGLGWAIYTYPP